MLFNSLHFLLFFPLVTLLYYLLPQRYRWAWLLAASCYFYMSFIPVYILVLAFVILVDYLTARQMENAGPAGRRLLLRTSVITTIAILFVFKYFNFFNTNIEALAGLLGWNYGVGALKLILPIGLSFHTFQSLSYVMEVYRGNYKAERHLGIYALYVMFYPQLVAGPIERPQNLIHQLKEPYAPDMEMLSSGLQRMLWGFIKKLVIADRLAIYVNQVYDAPAQAGGAAVWLAVFFFAFQI